MYPGNAAAQELHIALLQAPQQAEGLVPLSLFFQPGRLRPGEKTPGQGRVIGAQLLQIRPHWLIGKGAEHPLPGMGKTEFRPAGNSWLSPFAAADLQQFCCRQPQFLQSRRKQQLCPQAQCIGSGIADPIQLLLPVSGQPFPTLSPQQRKN